MCKDDDGAARHARRVHNRRIAAEERRTGPPKGSLSCTVTIGVLISPTRVRNGSRPTRTGCCTPGSSSALRGFATSCWHLAVAAVFGVLISPTRVRNAGDSPVARLPGQHGPHQPYEGSQLPGGHVQQRARVPVLTSPTRVRNTDGCSRFSAVMVVLISPTRVRNFVKRSTVYLSRRVLISPTRVRNVYRPCRWPTMRFSSPHQPYEGSQHGHLRLEYPPDVVLISP